MPRKARLDIRGHLYHLISRGNERRRIFFDDSDSADFLRRFRSGLEWAGAKCLAWSLIPNHFHFLVLRGEQPLSEMMRRVLTGYAVSFNLRHERCGHLFQNRYKSILCDEEGYLRELVGYIHLNPLRAKLVRDMEELADYNWCGHGELLGRRACGLVDRDLVLEHFGRDASGSVEEYKEFLLERYEKYRADERSKAAAVHVPGSPGTSDGNEARDPRILGSGEFVQKVLKEAGEEVEQRRPQEDILRVVFLLTGVKEDGIISGSQVRGVVRARALYCYLARKECGLRGVELAAGLGLTGGAVSRLVAKGGQLWINTKSFKSVPFGII